MVADEEMWIDVLVGDNQKSWTKSFLKICLKVLRANKAGKDCQVESGEDSAQSN